jgi:hypothetical protein
VVKCENLRGKGEESSGEMEGGTGGTKENVLEVDKNNATKLCTIDSLRVKTGGR